VPRARGQLQGFILDLRGNYGGLVDPAVCLAGSLLDGGAIAYLHGRNGIQSLECDPLAIGTLLQGGPLIVLVDGATAAGAELVAGALQARRGGALVGSRTFGKGTVQNVVPLPGGGAIRLTTARLYTPKGRAIQTVGIEPDVEVPPFAARFAAHVQRKL